MPRRRPNGYFQIRKYFPEWGENGWFVVSTGVKTKTEADILEQAVLKVARGGAWVVLDAVKDGHITLQDLKRLTDEGGYKGALKHVKALYAAQEMDRPLEELLKEFKENPPLGRHNRPIDRKTLSGYLGHIRQFVAWVHTRTGRPATVADLLEEALKEYRKVFTWARLTKGPRFNVAAMPKINVPATQYEKVLAAADLERLGEIGATFNRHMASLSKWIGWINDQGGLQHNPAKGLRISAGAENRHRRDTMRNFEDADVRALMKQAGVLDRARRRAGMEGGPDRIWLELLRASGVRTYSESLRIQVRDIETHNRKGDLVPLRVAGTKTEGARRTVWIPEWIAAKVLTQARQRKLRQTDLVFQFSKEDVRGYQKALFARLIKKGHHNFEGARLYDLRHTFAANAVKSGVPLETLKRLMGHSVITTTMIYAKFAPDRLLDMLSDSMKDLVPRG